MAGISSTCGIVQAVRSKLHGRKSLKRRRPQRCGPLFEVLEPRLLLSASATFATSALTDYSPKPPALIMPLTAGTGGAQTIASRISSQSASTSSGSYSTSLQLPANVEWDDTGISVAADNSITVGASGQVYVGDINAGMPSVSNYQTPSGTPSLSTSNLGGGTFAAPGLVPWSLVGRIGPSGTPFEVGSTATISATSSGDLYLSVNDNNFGDNSGSWNVSVALQAASSPQISSVIATTTSVAGVSYSNWNLTIDGSGFGSQSPFNGDSPDLIINDTTQGFQAGYSVPNDLVNVNVTSWTDSQIVINGFTGAYGQPSNNGGPAWIVHPGDQLQIKIANPQMGVTLGSYYYTVPAQSATPQVADVTFSGSGQDTTITITGSGFGSSPFSSPFSGDLNDFSLTDLQNGVTPLFEAGGAFFGTKPADTVTLNYQSWSDKEIVISGFGGTYGQNGDVLQPGDSVTVSVWNSADTSGSGPQTSLTVTVAPVTPPNITAVQIAPTGYGSYSITINGSGFGSSPVTTGYFGDTSYFRIADAAQLGHGEWGYTGDANQLTYQSWTDNQVVLTGFGASAGDAVTLAIWNPSSGLSATWGGNVPPVSTSTPQITGVTFSGSGQNTTITITGTDFGSAPFASPFTGDLNNLVFGDFRSQSSSGSSLFEAGGDHFGVTPADSVTLNYQSWSNNQIVISGFAGTYGQNGATLEPGDPVTITIWNSADTADTGPQTAWAGEVVPMTAPTISSVEISGNSGSYSVTVDGSGFGSSPVTTGYFGDTSYFRIADAAQLGHGEWGYTGDANQLTYQSWTDNQVVLTGFGASAGDAVTLAIWNPSSGLSATWGGNVPPVSTSTPQITGVTFSGSGQNTTITITGTDFGSAPFASPFTGDLNNLVFGDFRSQSSSGSSLFEAGGDHFGVTPADSVTLNYQSWSNNQIVISGFAGTYGQNGATLEPGDPVTITIWNSADTADTGPQTAWAGTDTPAPLISSVQFAATSSGSYSITVNGSGFGNAPVSSGYFGDTSYFRIADAAQLGHGEWGYTGDANQLTYQSWTDNQVVLTGFGASAGDAVTLAIWNPSSGLSATWGGNVPPVSTSTPQITGVTFSGSGQNTTITITGTDFGSAPFASPFTGDLNNLVFGDFRSQSSSGSSLFEAGGDHFGVTPADSVTLNYQSWSNNQIVISGFAGTYGQNGATLEPGDPVTITIWNSADTADTGPQTAWAGTVPTGTIVDRLVFAQQSSSVTAGTAVSPGVAVDVEDANGNIVTGDNSYVTLSISTGPTGGVIVSGATAQAHDGVAVFDNVMLITAGSYTLEAMDATDGLSSAVTTGIVVTPAAAAKLVFAVQPVDTTLGTAMQPVVVMIEDQYGNVETTDSSSVSLSLAGSPTGGTFTSGSTTTVGAVNGVATFGNLAVNQAGNYALTASAAAESLTSPPSNSFTIGSLSSAASLVINSVPASVVAGAVISPSVIVDIVDSNGSIVTSDDSNVTLNIATGPIGAELTGTKTAQARNGVAVFSGLSLNTSGTYNLQAVDAADILKSSPSVNINVVPAAASQLVFTTQPIGTVVSSTMTPVVVAIEDQYGNVELSDDSSVSLILGGGPSVAAFTGASTTTVDAINGVASFGNLAINQSGTYTLAASDTADNLTNPSSHSFTIDSASSAARLVITSVPASAIAGAIVSPSVTVSIEDASGNVITSDNAEITLSAATAPPGAGVEGTKNVQASNGLAVFSGLVLSKAGNYTLEATDAAEGISGVATTSIKVIPAAATQLVFTTQPNATTAGTTMAPAVVSIEDQYNNVVTSDNSAISLTVARGPGGFASGSIASVDAVGGVATFNDLALGESGTYTLQASDAADNLSSQYSNSIVITPAATAAQLSFKAVPATSIAGNALSTIIVGVETSAGGTLTSDNSTVTLDISGPNGNSRVNQMRSIAQNGEAVFTGLSLSKAGTYTVTASDSADGLTNVSSNLTISPAAAQQLAFTTRPPNTAAGNTMQPVVVRIEDQFGNLEIGDYSTVNLSVSGRSGFPGANPSANASGGVATFYGLVLDKAGSYTLTASDSADGLGNYQSGGFTVSAASPAKLEFVTQPTNSTTGTIISPAFTVAVEDSYGNRCLGNASAVTLSSPSGGTLGGTTTAYVVNGLATFNDVMVQTAGTYTLQASDDSLATATSNSFTVISSGPQYVTFGVFELYGQFQNDVATSTVEIGLSGGTFNPLINVVSGRVSYNSSVLSASGTVESDIGGVGGLFVGSFTVSSYQQQTSSVQVTTPALEVAGLTVTISGFSLPAKNEIEIQGSIPLPSPLNSISLSLAGGSSLLITSSGVGLTSAIQFPSVTFTLDGFQFDATDMSAALESGQLVLQGDFNLNDLFGSNLIQADFSGAGSGIFITSTSINLAGTIEVNQSLTIDGWGVQSASLNVNSETNTYSGSAEIALPGLPAVGASLGIVDGKVNSFGLRVGGFASPLEDPIGTTGIFLEGIGGSVSGIVTNSLTFSGTIYLTYGPDVPIALPGWLGGGSGNVDLLDLTVTATVSPDVITGGVTANFVNIDGHALATSNGSVDLNFATDTFTANLNFSLIDNIFTAESTLQIKPNDLTFYAQGNVNFPGGILWFVPNPVPLAGGGLYLDYAPNNPSDQFVEIWGTVVGLTGGAKVDLADGNVSLFYSQPAVPNSDALAAAPRLSGYTLAGASQTFEAITGTPDLLLNASWTNNATDVPIEVEAPDGIIYTSASFPRNMEMVGQLGGPTGETVGITKPTAGNWTIIIPDTTSLGTVSFSAVEGEPVVNPTLAFFQTPASSTTGTALGPLVVDVENGNGQLAINDNSPITLAVASGPGQLIGTTTVDAVDGVAQFNNVFLSTAGVYTLTASDTEDGINGVNSSSFIVSPAAPQNLEAVVEGGQAVVTWTSPPVSGGVTYDVYRTTLSGGINWLPIVTGLASTSFTDGSVVAGVSYGYDVSALQSGLLSKVSNEATVTPPVLVSASSVKTQGGAGTFGINLPLTGTPGIEDRIGGPAQLVLTFQNPISEGSSFNVTPSESTVNISSTSVSGDTLTINLSGSTDGQTLSVAVNDVEDTASGLSGNYALQVGVLYGDVDGDGVVNSNDINIIRADSGEAVTSANFQADIDADGVINSNDINIVRTLSGDSLTGPSAAVVAVAPAQVAGTDTSSLNSSNIAAFNIAAPMAEQPSAISPTPDPSTPPPSGEKLTITTTPKATAISSPDLAGMRITYLNSTAEVATTAMMVGQTLSVQPKPLLQIPQLPEPIPAASSTKVPTSTEAAVYTWRSGLEHSNSPRYPVVFVIGQLYPTTAPAISPLMGNNLLQYDLVSTNMGVPFKDAGLLQFDNWSLDIF